MNDDRRRAINILAYHIWEREGRPHGRAEAHWEEALREWEASGEPVGQDESPRKKPRASRKASADGGADGGRKPKRAVKKASGTKKPGAVETVKTAGRAKKAGSARDPKAK